MSTIDLASRLDAVVGRRTANPLAERLELSTVADLLRYYPRRYDQRGELTDLAKLVVGDSATVQARVISVQDRELRGQGGRRGVRRVTKVVVGDGRKNLTCTFFNQRHWAKVLHPGTEAMFSGRVSRFRDTMQITSPTVAVLDGRADGLASAESMEVLESFPGGIIPIYPLVDGITQSLLQRSVQAALNVLGDVSDPLPERLRADRDLIDLKTALSDVHRPRTRAGLDAARARLRYDEALAMQLVLARRRVEARNSPAVPCPRSGRGLLADFDARLPFTLTAGQQEVGEVIAADLERDHPMNRLLQGEVGSGKTVVALRAMLQVLDAGRQAVLLAPTEVLATQHARSLRQLLGPIGQGGELGAPEHATTITLLTGSLTAGARRDAVATIASGEPGIAVGTHALLSEDVRVPRLGLIVVDEQHRFGVEQRHALRTRDPDASPPHVLVMTATPIPRTVAMTVFGDLDTSTLAELPKGRSPVSTTAVPVGEKPAWLDRAWERAREEVARGRQVYVVCPMIADGDAEDPEAGAAAGTDAGGYVDDRPEPDPVDAGGPPLMSVTALAEMLRHGPLADTRLGVLHGRLPATEKDEVMRAFAAGRIDVLVATTVIEVGVDVPNASMMIIMDAERFGISQLHQLRGRVGRGSAPGVCLLVSRASQGAPGRARLDAVARISDGFALAEADLGLRREGDVLGTSQAGRSSSLRQLSLLRDRTVIEQARHDAVELVGDDPTLAAWPGLGDMVQTMIAVDSQEYLEKG